MSDATPESLEFFNKLTYLAENNDPIDPALYSKYNVKRGLRYSDGRGVLVGLTNIGDVVGYEMNEKGEKVPVPGRLMYRGYNVEELIKDAASKHQFGYEQSVYLLLFGQLPTQQELDEFYERHSAEMAATSDLNAASGPVFLGLDAGSTTTKAVLTDTNGAILWRFYDVNAGNPVDLAVRVLKQLYVPGQIIEPGLCRLFRHGLPQKLSYHHL